MDTDICVKFLTGQVGRVGFWMYRGNFLGGFSDF